MASKEYIDTCTRLHNPEDPRIWHSQGSVGWIDAAQRFADFLDAPDGAQIEVRDLNDNSRPPAIFTVRREVKYIVTNPRQGAD